MKNLSIIGAGSWGTALSIVLSGRFEKIRLWAHNPELAEHLERTRVNTSYLPDFTLPANIECSGDLRYVAEAAEVALLAAPSQHFRTVFRGMVPHLSPDALLLSATKGIENDSLMRMTEVLEQEASLRFTPRVGALSGPTFAREVAMGEPAALVVSSRDPEFASAIQQAFSGPTFRLYTNNDPIGVEIGAALKNVIAIAAGIVQGLGLGNNTLAALITRGLAEMSRLAVALGGDTRTLAGLAGLGDLVLTCTGALSRNRYVGMELGRGRSLPDILGSMKMVAEGVETTSAAVELATKHDIEMPVTHEMYAILRLGKSPRAGLRELMERSLKSE